MDKIGRLITIIITVGSVLGIIIGTTSFIILHIIYTNLEKSHVISTLEEIDIYSQVYDEVKSGFEEYIFQSGLEPKIFENICTNEKINNDFILVLNKLYGETNETIDSFEIKNNLDKEINAFVESQGKVLSPDEKEHIEEYENLITESYSNSMYSYLDLKDLSGKKISDFRSIINTWRVINFCITCFYIGVLISINKEKKSVAIGQIGITFFASGVLMIIITKIINSNIDIDNLFILTKVTSSSIIYIIRKILISINSCANVFINLGLFMMLVSSILGLEITDEAIKNRKKKIVKLDKNSVGIVIK